MPLPLELVPPFQISDCYRGITGFHTIALRPPQDGHGITERSEVGRRKTSWKLTNGLNSGIWQIQALSVYDLAFPPCASSLPQLKKTICVPKPSSGWNRVTLRKGKLISWLPSYSQSSGWRHPTLFASLSYTYCQDCILNLNTFAGG